MNWFKPKGEPLRVMSQVDYKPFGSVVAAGTVKRFDKDTMTVRITFTATGIYRLESDVVVKRSDPHWHVVREDSW